MTNETGGHLVPGIRCWCLVVLCGLAFSPQPSAADVTPTGTVDAVDVGPAGGSTPIPPTAGDLTFGAEIEVTLDTGQLLLDLGSVLTAGSIRSVGPGTVTVTGAGSLLDLFADRDRMVIEGPASGFQILNGGVIDATGGTCDPAVCDIYFGQFPGAEATVLVDGAGSQLNTVRSLFVARAVTDFGVVGADSIATIDVSNGGVINSENTLANVPPKGMAMAMTALRSLRPKAARNSTAHNSS